MIFRYADLFGATLLMRFESAGTGTLNYNIQTAAPIAQVRSVSDTL